MTETDNNTAVEVVIHPPPEPTTPYDWERIHGEYPPQLPPLPPEAD